MYNASKMFSKICLKAIEGILEAYFQYVICDQGTDEGTQFFL